MASWARRPNPSFSPSSSSSSSVSLPASSVLDIADDLWFCRSVLPLPDVSLPCFPPVLFSAISFSPPPDTSTLLAQCMRDRARFSPDLHSSAPPSPPSPTDLAQTDCEFCYLPPPPEEDSDAKDNVDAAYGYVHPFLSDSDDDDGWGYSRPASVEDEEAFHYYSATSDWDDEEAFNCHLPISDSKDESLLQSIQEDQVPAYLQEALPCFERGDALSGIYDVATLLKHQHYQEIPEEREAHTAILSSRPQHGAAKEMPSIPQIHALSHTDQADMKESLKLWAHAVALTLPWKAAAAKARPLL